MKKSLLALAILGTCAGVASAQTSVTVYGLVDAGVTYEGGGAAGSVTKLATGVQSGNRLGFKGTEDLGGGLKANFQLESGFNLDTGSGRQGALFGRQAWVGLSGGFGAVGLGRQYTPLFIALDSVDPFGTGLAGATTNLMNAGAARGDVRANNSITYNTPVMGGFSATAQYGLGEVPGDNSAGRRYGVSVGYANGPVSVVLAHDNSNNTLIPGTLVPVVAAVPATNTKLTLLAGTYDFGVAKLHAGYEIEKNELPAQDFRDWMLGVSAPVGTGTILASYIQKKDRNSTEAGGKQFALGYTYPLSKRTNFYTAIAQIKNDSNGTNFVGDASSGGTAPAAGESSRAFNIGIRHKF